MGKYTRTYTHTKKEKRERKRFLKELLFDFF